MAVKRGAVAILFAFAMIVLAYFAAPSRQGSVLVVRNFDFIQNAFRVRALRDWLPDEAGWERRFGYPVKVRFDHDEAHALAKRIPVGPKAIGAAEAFQTLSNDADGDLPADTGLKPNASALAAHSFSDAFRDLGVRENSRPNQVRSKGEQGVIAPPGVLGIKFNLASRHGAEGSIELSKTLFANGANKGKIALRIVNDTTIMIDAQKLASQFDDRQTQNKIFTLLPPDSGNIYVDFDTIRAAGFDVSYDPIRDIVVVEQHRT